MNIGLLRKLIWKDWYLQRHAIAGGFVTGAIGLGLMTAGKAAIYAGSLLLITALITVGVHLAIANVVTERKEQTLPFVMSLPISSMEYTVAKMAGNLLLFGVFWAALLLGCLQVIASAPGLPDGLIPYSAIILTEILVGTCLILSVALVTESQGWTIGTMMFANLFLNGFLYYVAHIPEIAQQMKGPTAIWSPLAIGLLLSEFAIALLFLSVALYLQGRKKSFV